MGVGRTVNMSQTTMSTDSGSSAPAAGRPVSPEPPRLRPGPLCDTYSTSKSRSPNSNSRSTNWKPCRSPSRSIIPKSFASFAANYTALLRKTYDNLSAWETVQVARHPQRPLFKDYVDMICREFRELHGDRHFGDDPAIICGLARLGGHKVMLIGHHKGRDTKEKVQLLLRPGPPRGVPQGPALHEAGREVRPAGRHADRHRRRLPRHRRRRARPGREHRPQPDGNEPPQDPDRQHRHRRRRLRRRTGHRRGRPRGHDGVRLVLASSAPRGAAASSGKAARTPPTRPRALKLTSKHLKQLGVIDTVVPEPLGGAHRDPHTAAHSLEQYIAKTLRELKRLQDREPARTPVRKVPRDGLGNRIEAPNGAGRGVNFSSPRRHEDTKEEKD